MFLLWALMESLGVQASMLKLAIGMQNKFLHSSKFPRIECEIPDAFQVAESGGQSAGVQDFKDAHIINGFTLIEILVVITIIGITLSFAMLAFGDFGATRQARTSAEHFMAYLRLLQHKAILEDQTLGLEIRENGYIPYQYDAQKKHWAQLNGHILFKPQTLPENVVIHPLKWSAPRLVIHSSGDLDSFSLLFGTRASKPLFKIVGTHDGKITLHDNER